MADVEQTVLEIQREQAIQGERHTQQMTALASSMRELKRSIDGLFYAVVLAMLAELGKLIDTALTIVRPHG